LSFYKQPLMYQCGPFALKYALVMLGKMEDEKEIENFAGSTWWYGTDEIGLGKAANHYECELLAMPSTGNIKDIIKNLNSTLRCRLPVILCVDKWGHWITVIRHEDGKYICVDSGEKKVIIIISKADLLRRWKYLDDKVPTYSWFTLSPWYKTRLTAKMNIDIAKKLMSVKYESLALHWNSYFEVLAEVTRNRAPLSEYTITFREFLRRNQKMLVELVADWQGDIEYKELNSILENFLFVAEVYDIRIHSDDEKTALITFSTVLTLYAASLYNTNSDL